jgi:putative PIN family toxin of toxin-antitoxin system
MARARVVLDTNALISRLLLPNSVPGPGRAVRKAMVEADVLVSAATMAELADVLSRPKFDRYVTLAERQGFQRRLRGVVEMVEIVTPVRACRDSRDDKFLEVAVNGGADVIVTGDADLLALHPFRGIVLLTPAAYLAR